MKKTIGAYTVKRKIEIEKKVYKGAISWYVFDGDCLCNDVKTEKEAEIFAKKMLLTRKNN